MNNDISGELTNYISPRIKHALKKAKGASKVQISVTDSAESYETAQKCYNALGHAKVSMDNGINNRVMNSIEILKKDPVYVQSYIDFCDSIQQSGYSLEDAIIGTDIIFEKLKDESIYKP